MLKGKNAVIFTLSMLLTLVAAAIAAIFCFTTLPEEQLEAAAAPAEKQTEVILACDTDNNVSYAVTINFNNSSATVKRLFYDNSEYKINGLSGMKKAAEKQCNERFDEAVAFTETQLAAFIDYCGGVEVEINNALSDLCQVDEGKQKLGGITAVKIFENEHSYRELCLFIVENTAYKWCSLLGNKRSFFKLIDISDSTLSYARYLPYQQLFKDKFYDNNKNTSESY